MPHRCAARHQIPCDVPDDLFLPCIVCRSAMHRVPLGRHAQVDLTDQLRGSYRPDRFMRQKKWWWSIYIWTVGTACTAAFITYNKVCAAHGIPKKKRMNHLRFQAKLAQQLCCPDKRVCPVQDGPRTSPRKHKQKASTASAPSASSGAGVGKAIRLSETRLQHVRASYASSASGHLARASRRWARTASPGWTVRCA